MLICCAFLGCTKAGPIDPNLLDIVLLDGGAGDDAGVDAGFDAGVFTWREVAPCPLARFEPMGVAVGGKLLVMGGFTSDTLAYTRRIHAYDPVTDTWTERAQLPGSPEHSGTALNGSTLYVAGGLDPINGSVWVLDTAADTWSGGTNLTIPRAAMALVFESGRLHALAGLAPDNFTDLDAHSVLDLSGDAGWVDQPGNVPNPRNHLGYGLIGNVIYLAGGRHHWDEGAGNQTTLSGFDLDAGVWLSGLPDMPDYGRSEIGGSTFAHRGKLYVVGGAKNPAQPTADVLVYDPATNAWSKLPPLPGPRKGPAAAGVGNQIIVTTGSPTGTDPVTTTWVGCCVP